LRTGAERECALREALGDLGHALVGAAGGTASAWAAIILAAAAAWMTAVGYGSLVPAYPYLR